MKSFWNSMIAAFASYSVIPMPNIELTEDESKYQLCFFPLIGAVIGLLLYGWSIAWPYLCNYNFLPAVVYAIVPIIISGATHVDGFIVAVDAICNHKPVEKKLEILRDTHIGSFAIIMSISYFLVYLGVWSEMPIDAIPLLAVGFVLSRALSGFAIVTFPHARTSNLRKRYADDKTKGIVRIVMAVYIAVCAVVMCVLQPIYGCIGVFGAAISFAFYYYISKTNFGGITGAVASFFIQICELIVPLVVLIGWKFE